MGKAETRSFVLELPLRVEQGMLKILLARLEVLNVADSPGRIKKTCDIHNFLAYRKIRIL